MAAFPQDLLSRIINVQWQSDRWLFIGAQYMLDDYYQRTDVGGGVQNSLLPNSLTTPADQNMTFTLTNHNAANLPDTITIQNGVLPSSQVYVYNDAGPGDIDPLEVYYPVDKVDDPLVDNNDGNRMVSFLRGEKPPGVAAPWFVQGRQFFKRSVYLTRALFGNDGADPFVPGDIHSFNASLLINLKNLRFKTPLDSDAQLDKFRFTVDLVCDNSAVRAQSALFVLTGKKMFSALTTFAFFNVTEEPTSGTEAQIYFGCTDGGWNVSPYQSAGDSQSGKCNVKTLALEGLSLNNAEMVDGSGPWGIGDHVP